MHMNNAPYSLLARINPSNSMIMQAVSSPSLNVLMGFFRSHSLARSRLRDARPILLLTIVRAQGKSESLS